MERETLPERVKAYLAFGDKAHDSTRSNQERVIFDVRQLETFDNMTQGERDVLADYGQALQDEIVHKPFYRPQ